MTDRIIALLHDNAGKLWCYMATGQNGYMMLDDNSTGWLHYHMAGEDDYGDI